MFKVIKYVNHRDNLTISFKVYLNKRKFSLNTNILFDPQNDYYATLNVKENAEMSEIKKSFFSLSMKLHPDKGGNENDFKKLNTAYEVLKNEEDRRQYDKLRQEHLEDIEKKVYNKQSNNEKNRKEKKETRAYSNNNDEKFNNYKKNYYKKYDYYAYNSSYNYNYQNMSNDDDNEYYYGNKSKEGGNYEYKKENRAFDYDYYTDFLEFIKKYQKYNNSNSYYQQNQSQFEKFKINVKYTPTKDISYADFIIDKSHKHHRDNRNQYYKNLKLMNYIKLGYNPFELKNNMTDDLNYLNTLNYSNLTNEDERLKKRISLRDIFRVYGKFTIILFSLFNIIFLTNIIIK